MAHKQPPVNGTISLHGTTNRIFDYICL